MKTGYRKVVVVGLDGLEPTLVDALVSQGELPHLRSLISGAAVSRLATTYPAQTPVAWSTFATGLNPGGHGIFDFIRREPGAYLPSAALNRFEQKNRFLPPKAVNLRQGKAIWEILGEAGIPSVVLRCPCTFPPDSFSGRMLSGMGVPDLLGAFGNATFYAVDPPSEGEAETVLPLRRQGHEYQSQFLGPRHPRTRERIQVPFRIDVADETGWLHSDGSPKKLSLAKGVWSDWLHLKFSVGPLQSVRGMVRLLLVQGGPTPKLYVSPVNFDPAAPLFPISHPAQYARDLENELGTFYTTGMVEDHAGLSNGRFDDEIFLEQCESVLVERERMLFHELGRMKEGFLFCLFDTPDRLQHMCWRFREPEHPANAGSADNKFRFAIDAMYKRCDQIIGQVLSMIDEETLFIGLSDHGFGSFQRGVNLNTWLYEHGYLALLPGVSPGADTQESFQGFDWRRTRAYSLGLGGIYLNKVGREPEGIVLPSDEDAVLGEIVEKLGGITDPARGNRGIRRVVRSTDIYQGPYVREAPDLLALFERGYRASWGTSLGGLSQEIWEDNTKRWSGDHIVDPEVIPGVIFSNRPLDLRQARIIDLAPTILNALGVSAPTHLEGSSLLQ